MCKMGRECSLHVTDKKSIQLGKLQEKKPLERPGRRWDENNTKISINLMRV
jgi:hypothetical protein